MSQYLTYFLNYGVLGLNVFGFMSGFLYTRFSVNEIKANYERKIAEMKEDHEDEVRELRHALELERQRSDIGITAGKVLRDIAVELRKELQQ